jgi:predicted O-linked N-acetylglucosamine transferase (SPINDLY family)
VLRLDHCYLPGGDPARPVPQACRPRAHRPSEGRHRAVFLQPAIKLRPEVFANWCALLQQLPNAVLMLGDPGEPARQRLVAAAARWRVDSRLIFARHSAP